MMQRIATYFFCGLLGLACTLSVSADDNAIDWPAFQGNNARTGASDYPPIDKPEIVWKKPIGIMGYLNCPVIDGDTVFVTSSGSKHNESDNQDGVYALSMATGDILWHRKTEADACGIAIDRRFVYAGDDGGRLQAIDRETGKTAWSRDFDGSVFAQPLLIDGLVVIGDEAGGVFACDAKTGDIQWIYDGNAPVRAGLSSDGTRLFAVFLRGQIVCLDTKGKALWTKDLGKELNDTIEVYPAPTIADGRVYIGYARDTTYDVPALASYTTEGELAWANKTTDFQRPDGRIFCNLRNSPAVYKGFLIHAEPYGNETAWTDRKTGRFVSAERTGLPMFPQWPSPVIAKDVVYVARHDGGLYAMDMARDNRLVWTMYLGDHSKTAVNNKPSEQPHKQYRSRWDPTRGRPIYATPAIAKDGTIVIGTGEGWLYCIRQIVGD